MHWYKMHSYCVACSFCCIVVEMESGKAAVDEVDKDVKTVKKTTPPAAPKLKRSAEKRKISDDSNLASVNIRVCLLMGCVLYYV